MMSDRPVSAFVEQRGGGPDVRGDARRQDAAVPRLGVEGADALAERRDRGSGEGRVRDLDRELGRVVRSARGELVLRKVRAGVLHPRQPLQLRGLFARSAEDDGTLGEGLHDFGSAVPDDRLPLRCGRRDELQEKQSGRERRHGRGSSGGLEHPLRRVDLVPQLLDVEAAVRQTFGQAFQGRFRGGDGMHGVVPRQHTRARLFQDVLRQRPVALPRREQ